MTSDPESSLFEFAGSNRKPETEDEMIVTELHTAIGTRHVPIGLMRPPMPVHAPSWRRYMNIAVAAILIVAMIGASFSFLSTDSKDPKNNHLASVPPVVLGLATPATSEVHLREPHEPIPGLGATERDMPIIVTYADTLPTSNNWFTFNPVSYQMKIRFNFEQGYAELVVRNGVDIRPTFYPNIFLAYAPNAVQIVNISSLSMISIQTEMTADEIDRINLPIRSSRWMVIPDSNLIVDTHKMSVMSMNQYVQWPQGIYEATTNDHGASLVIAIALEDESSVLARISPDDQVEIIETEHDYQSFWNSVISPDGRYLATQSNEIDGTETSNTIDVIDLDSGQAVATADIPGKPGVTAPIWVEDSRAIVFSGDGEIRKLTIETDQVETIYSAPGTEMVLRKTRDSNMVLVQQDRSNVSTAEVESDNPIQVIILDVRDGSMTAHDGRDQQLEMSSPHAVTRNAALVEESPALSTTDPLDITVVDTTTGDVIGTIDRPALNASRTGAVRSAWGSEDGDIRFASWGSQFTYMITDTNGNATLEQIPPPPGSASEDDLAVDIQSSADSGWLAMHIEIADEWWILDRTDIEAEWQKLPTTGDSQIMFVSAGANIDATSSNATPVATTSESAICDVSSDTPLFMGLEDSPVAQTSVLVTSEGELTIACGSNKEVLAEYVDTAFPMQVPNLVMADTASGVRIINIATKESLDFPYRYDVFLQNQSEWVFGDHG